VITASISLLAWRALAIQRHFYKRIVDICQQAFT
jgi:hypothetical protein